MSVSSSMKPRPWAPLVAFADNAVFVKDAGLQLRAPALPALWAVAALLPLCVAGLVVAAVEPNDVMRASHATLDPAGRPLLAAVFGVVSALVSLVAPGISATSIAGERERGTLPLLRASALSPAQLVLGKWAAAVVTVAPLAWLALPAFSLALVFGDQSALLVLGAVALLAVHAAALCALGVAGSALSSRPRGAIPLALISAVGLGFLVPLPALVGLSIHAEGQAFQVMVPWLAVGLVVELGLAAAALALSIEQLGPRRLDQRRLRDGVFAGLLALPLVALGVQAAVVLSVRGGLRASRIDDVIMSGGVAVALCAVLLVLGPVVAAPLFSDAARAGGRTPAESGRRAALWGAAAVLLLSAVSRAWIWASGLDGHQHGFALEFWRVASWMGVSLTLSLAGLSAALASRWRTPTARVLAMVVLGGAVFLVPPLLGSLWQFVMLEPVPFSFLHPVGALACVDRSSSEACRGFGGVPAAVWCLAVHGAGGAGLLGLAHRARRPA